MSFGILLACFFRTMATLKEMTGIPSPTPGSAEGTVDIDDQSHTPPASHTPGSAEGEDKAQYDGEDADEKTS